MEYSKEKTGNKIVVTLELDLRREKRDKIVNYNTSNVIDLMKENKDWSDDMVVLSEAYVDNSDPRSLTGVWTFELPTPPAPPVVKKQKAPAKKAPAKKASPAPAKQKIKRNED